MISKLIRTHYIHTDVLYTVLNFKHIALVLRPVHTGRRTYRCIRACKVCKHLLFLPMYAIRIISSYLATISINTFFLSFMSQKNEARRDLITG